MGNYLLTFVTSQYKSLAQLFLKSILRSLAKFEQISLKNALHQA